MSKRYNSQKQENNTGKVVLGALAALLLFGAGGAAGYIISDAINENQMQQSSEVEDGVGSSIIEQEGLQVKRLSSVTNDDGSVTQTFSYTITPENASNQNVTATAKYKDGTDCSAVVTVAVDNTAKTISVTCLGDFSKQVIVTVVSAADSSKTATIAVDYEKKVTAIDCAQGFSDAREGLGFNGETSFAFSDLVSVSYSEYTINKNYTFKVSNVAVSESYFETPSNPYDDGDDLFYAKATSAIADHFKNEITTKWASKTTSSIAMPTSSTLWNAYDDNSYHAYLKYMGTAGDQSNNYYTAKVVMTVTCNEMSFSKQLTGYINVGLNMDYSAFSVNVDSIAVETPSIVF